MCLLPLLFLTIGFVLAQATHDDSQPTGCIPGACYHLKIHPAPGLEVWAQKHIPCVERNHPEYDAPSHCCPFRQASKYCQKKVEILDIGVVRQTLLQLI